MSHRPIRFFNRGDIVSVAGAHPTRSVLDWLREDARRVGTKEGCNEGDCGACTVVVAELAAPDAADAVRGLMLRAVNACLMFLPALDGKALYTVEDLKGLPVLHAGMGGAAADDADAGAALVSVSANATALSPARVPAATAAAATALSDADSHPTGAGTTHDPAALPLHPVQRALVDCHGSQCGFCTPGFAMSLWSVYECHDARGSRPTRRQLADALSGNLCRCTGYRPILDAGERMFDLPPVRLDTAATVTALRRLRVDAGETTFDYAAPNPAVVDAAGLARIDRFHAPRTLDALAALRAAKPAACLIAGTTDVGLWVTKQFHDLGDLVSLAEVAALKRIDEAGHELTIGAGASLEDAWRALVRRFPALTEVWLRFASVPIRNAGTLGGNVANGSPVGDAAPVLMALDAQLDLRCGERVRRMPLAEFHTGYMQNRLEAGEFVQTIRVPLPGPGRPAPVLRAYKIAKRFDCDISAVCAGLALALDGDTVREARLAWGGMAATVRRAPHAEAALAGRHWNEPALRAAQAALAADFTPLTDLRASAAYRLQVARNLLERFWLATRSDAPLNADALGVWHPMTPVST